MSRLIRKMKYWGLVGLIICYACGNNEKKPVLDQQKFTSLLIDMHATDGMLSINRGFTHDKEKKTYACYNGLFERYGITKAEFDSCMYFYSSQTKLFTKIYETVIDSLSRRLTVEERVLQKLMADDSVNYYTGPDTLLIDTFPFVYEYVVDSLKPGNYKFNVMARFDTLDAGKNNRITAWFISADHRDTLKAREIRLVSDTLSHHYQWSQYADTVYNRLVIRFMDADNLKKLKYRKARIWDIQLFKPYISAKKTDRLMRNSSKRIIQ